MPLTREPGLRIPNMLDEAVDGTFKGIYIQGEDIAQSDPDTQHVVAGLEAMECVVVQDLFLNETAKYAHVFLPGSSFLEKDGTFTNAERRISRVRKVMTPLAGIADWEVTIALSKALGYPMHYAHPSEIMDEIAALTPTFAGVSYDRIDELGSIQWPCNDDAPGGTPIMHVGPVRARQGQVHDHRVRADGGAHRAALPADADHRPHPLASTMSARRRGAPTNVVWHAEDVLEIHPFDAESRGIRDGDLVALAAASGETSLRALVTERMQPGVVYTTFHHAETGANVVTTEYSDWATNCPEYKVTAVRGAAHEPDLAMAGAPPARGA